MSFLLDTNICTEHLKRPAGLAHRFTQHAGRLAIPTLVLAELYTWAYQRADPAPLLRSLGDDLLPEVAILPFDEACALRFGGVRGALLRSGVPVSRIDLMIAAVALVHDLTLVTHNTKDFAAIPGLRLEDWLRP